MNQNLLAVVSSPTSFSEHSTMSIDSALQAQTQNLFVNPLFLAVSSLMLSTPRSSSAPPSPFALQALTRFLICQPSFSCSLIPDIVHCTELERSTISIDSALQTMGQLCVDSAFQEWLLSAGVLWFLLPLLLQYDATAEKKETGGPQVRLPSFWVCVLARLNATLILW